MSRLSWLARLRDRWKAFREPPAAQKTVEAWTLPGIPGRVHVRDAMLYDTSEPSITNYVRAGRSALANVEEALGAAGRSFASVTACLDFGCGHGRVLRFLAERLEPQRITACDVDPEAVRFCAEELGVRPLVSTAAIQDLCLGRYDLIWVGSVLTHLPPQPADDLLRVLGGALVPEGILIFSVHGRFVVEHLAHLYGGLFAGVAADVQREVAEHGISYRPYEGILATYQPIGDYAAHAYGGTWHDPAYLEAKVAELFHGELTLLCFRERGWDEHHDVFAFQRRSSAPAAPA